MGGIELLKAGFVAVVLVAGSAAIAHMVVPRGTLFGLLLTVVILGFTVYLIRDLERRRRASRED